MDIRETLKNIINAARKSNAREVKNGIHAVLSAKVRDVLAKKEIEIAKKLFKG